MTELHGDIKKLMRLAKRAPDGDTTPPVGFAARVVSRHADATETAIVSPRVLSLASWTSASVLVVCVIVLVDSARTPKPATNLMTATHLLAQHLTP